MPTLQATFQLVVLAQIRGALGHGADVDIARLDAAAGRRLGVARVIGARLLHGVVVKSLGGRRRQVDVKIPRNVRPEFRGREA